MRITKDITDTYKNGVSMTKGLYVTQLHEKCGALDDMKYPRHNMGSPLPGN